MVLKIDNFPTKLSWEKIENNDYEKNYVKSNEDREIVSAWNVASNNAQVILYESKEKYSMEQMAEAFNEIISNNKFDSSNNVLIESFGVEQIGTKQVFFSLVKSVALQNLYIFELHFEYENKNIIYFVRFENKSSLTNFKELKSLKVISDIIDIIGSFV